MNMKYYKENPKMIFWELTETMMLLVLVIGFYAGMLRIVGLLIPGIKELRPDAFLWISFIILMVSIVFVTLAILVHRYRVGKESDLKDALHTVEAIKTY